MRWLLKSVIINALITKKCYYKCNDYWKAVIKNATIAKKLIMSAMITEKLLL